MTMTPIMKLTTLAIAVAMLAACGGGGPSPDPDTNAANNGGVTATSGNDNSFTATTSIGAISTNNIDASRSTYQEGERY